MRTVDIAAVHRILKKEVKRWDVPIVDLIQVQTRDPFKVLLATILSARTQDATTAKAAKRLFAEVKSMRDLEMIKVSRLEKLIYPVGFYQTKARNLKKLPEVLAGEFDGRIPDTVEDLIKLPGVGRKTANLVVVVAFDKPAVCVDTHVHRISNRLGYVRTGNPLETEMALRDKLPVRYWKTINSLLVAFGQNLCRPIGPKCSICPVSGYCNRIGVKDAR